MELKLVLTLSLITFSCGIFAEENYILSEKFIEEINHKANGKWTAGRNFPLNTPRSTFIAMMGVLPDSHLSMPPVRDDNYSEQQLKDIPEEFDSRQKWEMCDSIRLIWDQGSCGSCWAFGAASAMSDRICIHSPKNEMQVLVSPQEIMSCCNYCGDGCKGGDPAQAWDYWYNSGVVSGGLYGNTETCQPYLIKPCEHHVEGPRPKCNDKEPTPKCEHQCQDNYPKHFTEDKHYGKHSYGISKQNEKIQMELMNNGPIEAAFTVYEDFLNYKSGVYQHIHGKVLGGHAVRVLGWGVENGAAYWLVSNSWNTDWGDKGAFKILRGHNECGIEHYLVAGMPDFDRKK